MSTSKTLMDFNPETLGSIGTSFIKSVTTTPDGEKLSVELTSGTVKEMGNLLPSPAKNLTGVSVDENNVLWFEMDDGASQFNAGVLQKEITQKGNFPKGDGVLNKDGILVRLKATGDVSLEEQADKFVVSDTSSNVIDVSNVADVNGTTHIQKTFEYNSDEPATGTVTASLLSVAKDVFLKTGRHTARFKAQPKGTESVTVNVRDSETQTLIKSKVIDLTIVNTTEEFRFELSFDLTENKNVDFEFVASSIDTTWSDTPDEEFVGKGLLVLAEVTIESFKLDTTALVQYTPPPGESFEDLDMASAYFERHPNDYGFRRFLDTDIIDAFHFVKDVGDELVFFPNKSSYVIQVNKQTGNRELVPVPLDRNSGIYSACTDGTLVYFNWTGEEFIWIYDPALKVFYESDLPTYIYGPKLIWSDFEGKILFFNSAGTGHYPYDPETGTFSALIYTVNVTENKTITATLFSTNQTNSNSFSFKSTAMFSTDVFHAVNGELYSDPSIINLDFKDGNVVKLGKNINSMPRLETNDFSAIGVSRMARTLPAGAQMHHVLMDSPGAMYYTDVIDLNDGPEFIDINKHGSPVYADGVKLVERASDASYGPANEIKIMAVEDNTLTRADFDILGHSGSYYGEAKPNFNIEELFKFDWIPSGVDPFRSWQTGAHAWMLLEMRKTPITSIYWRNGYVSTRLPPSAIRIQQSDDQAAWEDVPLATKDFALKAKEEWGRTVFDAPQDCIGIRVRNADFGGQLVSYKECFPVWQDADGNYRDIGYDISEEVSGSEFVLSDGTRAIASSLHSPNPTYHSFKNLFNGREGGNNSWVSDPSDLNPSVTYMFPESRKVVGFITSSGYSGAPNTTTTVEYTTDGETWNVLREVNCPWSNLTTWRGSPVMALLDRDFQLTDDFFQFDLITPVTKKYMRLQFVDMNGNRSICFARLKFNYRSDADFQVVHEASIPDDNPGTERETIINFPSEVKFNRFRVEVSSSHGGNRWVVNDIIPFSSRVDSLNLKRINSLTDEVIEDTDLEILQGSLTDGEYAGFVAMMQKLKSSYIGHGETGVECIYDLDQGNCYLIKNSALTTKVAIDPLGINYFYSANRFFYYGDDQEPMVIEHGKGKRAYRDGIKSDTVLANEVGITTAANTVIHNVGNDEIIVVPNRADKALVILPYEQTIKEINYPKPKPYLKATATDFAEASVAVDGKVIVAPSSGTDFIGVFQPNEIANRKKITNPKDNSEGFLAVPETLDFPEEVMGYQHPKIVGESGLSELNPMRSADDFPAAERVTYDTSAVTKAELVFDFKKPLRLTGLDLQNGDSKYFINEIPEPSKTFDSPIQVKGIRVKPSPMSGGRGLSAFFPVFVGESGEDVPLTVSLDNVVSDEELYLADGTKVTSTQLWSGFRLSNLFTGEAQGTSWYYTGGNDDFMQMDFTEVRSMKSIRVSKNYPAYANNACTLEYTTDGTNWETFPEEIDCPYNATDYNGRGWIYTSETVSVQPNYYQLYSSNDGETWNEIGKFDILKDDIVNYSWFPRFNFAGIESRYLKITFPAPGARYSLSRLVPITDEETFVTDDYHRSATIPKAIDELISPWATDSVLNKFYDGAVLSESKVIFFPNNAMHPVIVDLVSNTWSTVSDGFWASKKTDIVHTFRDARNNLIIIGKDGNAFFLNEDLTVDPFPATFPEDVVASAIHKDGYRYFHSFKNTNIRFRLNLVNYMNSSELYSGSNLPNSYFADMKTTGEGAVLPRLYNHTTHMFNMVNFIKKTSEIGPETPLVGDGFSKMVRLSKGDFFLLCDGNKDHVNYSGMLVAKDGSGESDPDFEALLRLEG